MTWYVYALLVLCLSAPCTQSLPVHYTSVGFTCLALPLLVIRALSTAMASQCAPNRITTTNKGSLLNGTPQASVLWNFGSMIYKLLPCNCSRMDKSYHFKKASKFGDAANIMLILILSKHLAQLDLIRSKTSHSFARAMLRAPWHRRLWLCSALNSIFILLYLAVLNYLILASCRIGVIVSYGTPTAHYAHG